MIDSLDESKAVCASEGGVYDGSNRVVVPKGPPSYVVSTEAVSKDVNRGEDLRYHQ